MKLASKLSLLTGTLALATMMTSNAKAADLSGVWAFTSQVCASGAATNPAAGSPNGTLTVVANSSVQLDQVQDGCTIVVGPAAVTITDDKITPVGTTAPIAVTCPGGPSFNDVTQVSELPYTLAGNVISFKSPAVVGDKQACAAGDSIIVSYTKTN